MRITILTYLEHEEDTTWDVVVDQVRDALKAKGHTPTVVGVHGDLRKLIGGIEKSRPDLVFNLVEMFGDDVTGDINVSAVLNILGVPYTGCGPAEAVLAQDKALAKKILAFEKIAYPQFAVFSKDADIETGGHLRMPLFVKPLRMDASIGIDEKSLVHDSRELMRRVLTIHDKVGDSALAEEYIEGRELYVGVLGNMQPEALPPVEVDFSGMPEGKAHILDSKAKWDESSDVYKGTRSVMAKIPDELRARLQKVSVDAYRALRVRDYGRVDLRLTDAGDIYVIEVNASCYLEKGSEFAMAAKAAGYSYEELVEKIVQLAMERAKKAERRAA